MYDPEKMKQATRMFLEAIGEETDREGLKETPDRVARLYAKLLNGYDEDPKTHVKMFKSEGRNNMVTVSNVPIYSFCEHHMVPFLGKIHMAYIAQDKEIGLSKLVRLARVYAGRLQVQERLTNQIADCMMEHLNAKGVAVQIQANHFCMVLRGVRAQGSITTTTAVRGMFYDDPKTRDEFLQTIKHQDSVFSY